MIEDNSLEKNVNPNKRMKFSTSYASVIASPLIVLKVNISALSTTPPLNTYFFGPKSMKL